MEWPTEKSDRNTCVLCNGIPKCGTYLLKSIVANTGLWKSLPIHATHTGWRYLHTNGKTEPHTCDIHGSVSNILNGQVIATHMEHSKSLESLIDNPTPERNIRHIMIHRDPRDAMVSYMNWATYSKKFVTSKESEDEQRMVRTRYANDDARLSWVIGRKGIHDARPWYEYKDWLEHKNTLCVKFEDLYPELLDLEHSDDIGNTLQSIFDYLEVEPSTIEPKEFFWKVYNNSRTSTELKDKVGQYKTMFSKHHHNLMDNAKYREVAKIYGYDWYD